MNDLKERYLHHFTWAEGPTRYQIIIDGLRVEQMEKATDLDKTNRYATNIQNRFEKGIATLAVMDQHEHQFKIQSESLNETKVVLLPPQGEGGKSD